LDESYSDFESENEVTENEDQLEERNSEQFKKRAGFNDTPLEDAEHEVTSILNDLMDLNTNNYSYELSDLQYVTGGFNYVNDDICENENEFLNEKLNPQDFDSKYIYDLNKGQPLENFKINLGTSFLPKTNCANHKCDNAVRAAMIKHGKICDDLKNLNIYISKVKNTIEINKIFARLKCRLRLDKKVRWGSGFTVLVLVRKAFEKKAIKEVYLKNKLQCPLSLKVINNYIEVLKPAYRFNIRMQTNSITISDVIPQLLRSIGDWNVLINSSKTTISCKKMCKLLISEFTERFDYELNSMIYKVIKNLDK
jgi:hypothetical protein